MSGTLRSLLPAVVVVGLAVLGCGASNGSVQRKHAATLGEAQVPASSTAIVRSGSLTATLTATPTRVKRGSIVQFAVTASERRARGALGYRLLYGDGASAENVVPMFCLAGRGTPVRHTWRLSHRYRSSGRYTASLSVYVNCTQDRALAHITVIVT
jgi:hypothetical protein